MQVSVMALQPLAREAHLVGLKNLKVNGWQVRVRVRKGNNCCIAKTFLRITY